MDGIATQCGMVGSAAGGLPAPLHYWDLDDHTSIPDLAGSYDMTTLTSLSTVTSGGPGSRNCVNVPFNGYALRSSSAWDGTTNDQKYTASIWVKFDSLKTASESGDWFFSWRAGGAPPRIFQIYRSRSADRFTGTVISDTTVSSFSATAPDGVDPALNTWYHVVMTADGSEAVIYVDGVEEAALDISSLGSIDAAAAPLCLGDAGWGVNGSNTNFNGKIALAGIWDEALTAAQVLELYNSGDGLSYSEIAAETATYESEVLADSPLATRNLSGTAEVFSGTNEYAIGDGTDTTAINSSNAFTLEGIISVDSLVGDGTIIGRMGSNSERQALLWFDEGGTPNFRFIYYSGDGSVAGGVTSETPTGYSVTTGVDYHVVGTFDGASLKLYVNGVEVDSVAVIDVVRDSSLGYYVGNDDISGSRNLTGTGKGFAIYDSALSSTRVLAHHNVSGI